MYHVNQMIGKSVVTTGTGERVGTVSDALLDTEARRLVGLVIGNGLLAAERVLPLSDVETFGRDAVLVRTNEHLMSPRAWRHFDVLATRWSAVAGRRVVTASGRQLGHASDLLVNEETGTVGGIEVDERSLAGLRHRRRVIAGSFPPQIGPDAIIVGTENGNAEVGEHDTPAVGRQFMLLLALGCASAVYSPPASAAVELRSPALATELQRVMGEKKLDAIALQDPDAAETFIAALVIPKVQLLVVSAQHPSPEYLKWQIEKKQYREIYSLLQQRDITPQRVFFQDIGADGLPAIGSTSVDVMYDRGVQMLFGAAGAGDGMSAETYQQKLGAADARYSRLLKLAIEAAQAHAS